MSKPYRFAFCILAAVVALLLAAVWSGTLRTSKSPASVPLKLGDLSSLPADQLKSVDIALMNLICAEGLPGAEGVVSSEALSTLDEWTARVRAETERNFHRFRESPAAYENSEAFFRVGMLITVLQQDCGVRYNPVRIERPERPSPNDVFFADSRDIFLHGLLSQRRMGTCVSLPVLYVAIGRRLGYPLKLVTTRSHLFFRWEGAERMNFEGSGRGISTYPDEHYMVWPYRISQAERQAGGYLESLPPERELALFVETRGFCLLSAGRRKEAEQAFECSRSMSRRSATSVLGSAAGSPSSPRRALSRSEIDAMARSVLEQNAAAARASGWTGVEASTINPESGVAGYGQRVGLPAEAGAKPPNQEGTLP